MTLTEQQRDSIRQQMAAHIMPFFLEDAVARMIAAFETGTPYEWPEWDEEYQQGAAAEGLPLTYFTVRI